MDHFEIIAKIKGGSTLEIMHQTEENLNPKAFLDGEPVSVTQAFRASISDQVKISAKCSEWSAYVSI